MVAFYGDPPMTSGGTPSFMMNMPGMTQMGTMPQSPFQTPPPQ